MLNEYEFPSVDIGFAGISSGDPPSNVFFNIFLAEIERLKDRNTGMIPEVIISTANSVLTIAIAQCALCRVASHVCSKIKRVDLKADTLPYQANLTVLSSNVTRHHTVEQQIKGARCGITRDSLYRAFPVK